MYICKLGRIVRKIVVYLDLMGFYYYFFIDYVGFFIDFF